MSSNLSEISHDQLAVRRQKLEDLRSQGVDPFRSSFQPTYTAVSAVAAYVEGAEEENQPTVSVAGRLKFIRKMGKAQFVKIQDQTGIIQSYVRIDALGEEAYANFKKLDTGDIIGVEGTLFQTKTGEVTVRPAIRNGLKGIETASGEVPWSHGSGAADSPAALGSGHESGIAPSDSLIEAAS